MKKSLMFIASAFCFCASLSLSVNASAFYKDVYNVEKGDTLWKISRKYYVPLSDVVETNSHLSDPDLIYPDDTVYIPHASNGKLGASTYDNGDGSVSTSGAKLNRNSGLRPQAAANGYEMRVAQLVNKERAERGLPLLRLSEDISNIARVKSEDMRDSKYFDHTSPIYGSPFVMMKEFGIKYTAAGENIAKGQKTPEDVMRAWMNSEGHRKNILNPDYSEIGVGFVIDNYGATYWTQQFLSR